MQAIIRKATSGDAKTVAGLAIKMWKSHTIEELTEEFSDYISQGNCVVVLAMLDDCAIGFAQCGLMIRQIKRNEISDCVEVICKSFMTVAVWRP